MPGREIIDKQSNILPHDLIRNNRDVDQFLWSGQKNITTFQRIGGVVIALTFICLGTLFGLTAWTEHLAPLYLLTVMSCGIAARIFYSMFRKQ